MHLEDLRSILNPQTEHWARGLASWCRLATSRCLLEYWDVTCWPDVTGEASSHIQPCFLTWRRRAFSLVSLHLVQPRTSCLVSLLQALCAQKSFTLQLCADKINKKQNRTATMGGFCTRSGQRMAKRHVDWKSDRRMSVCTVATMNSLRAFSLLQKARVSADNLQVGLISTSLIFLPKGPNTSRFTVQHHLGYTVCVNKTSPL